MEQAKILGRLYPTGNVGADADDPIYEVPGANPVTYDGGNIQVLPSSAERKIQVVVTSIVVADVLGAANSFSVAVSDLTGDTVANINYLAKEIAISANSTKVIHFGMLLSEGNTIKVGCTTTGLAFTVFGLEIS